MDLKVIRIVKPLGKAYLDLYKFNQLFLYFRSVTTSYMHAYIYMHIYIDITIMKKDNGSFKIPLKSEGHGDTGL